MTEAIDLDASADDANGVARAKSRNGKSLTKRPAKPKPESASPALSGVSEAHKPGAGRTKAQAKPAQAAETKASVVLKKLQSPKGMTIDVLMEATGWQAHSVRGFLSAVVKKKLGLKLVSEIAKDGVRRYRVENAGKAK